MVNKPEQSTEAPDAEDVSAVKETTDAVEDEAVPTVEAEPVLTIEDGKPITATEFVQSLVELKDQLKAAGMRPIQKMVTSYASQGLSVINGLLESLEGKKKKGK